MPAVPARRITRFTVMATLQAARARKLGLAEPSAFSWGLNRAIFYAAAKRGFSGAGRGGGEGEASRTAAETNLYQLGEDHAYRDPESKELLFTIGGETQTQEDFERQVAARFGSPENFRRAWDEAVRTVDAYDDEVLGSPRLFYSEVYKPRRDDLVAKWSEEFLGTPPVPAAPRSSRARSRT